MNDATHPQPLPTVSISIPVYNAGRYIEQCATSLFEQTYREHIEYIFVDDASTDNSLAVLRAVARRYPQLNISIHAQERNTGPAAIRNMCIAQAKGQYFMACDSDDWIEPDMVETLARRALATGADIVTSPMFTNTATKQRAQYFSSDAPLSIDQMKPETVHFSLCNKIIRLSLLTENSLYATSGVDGWEDLSICSRAYMLTNKVELINRPMYHYRLHSQPSLTKVNHKTILRYRLFYTDQIAQWMEQHNQQHHTAFANSLKFMAKVKMLRGCPIEITRWKSTYPECHRRMLTAFPYIALHHRVMFALVAALPAKLTIGFLKMLGIKAE